MSEPTYRDLVLAAEVAAKEAQDAAVFAAEAVAALATSKAETTKWGEALELAKEKVRNISQDLANEKQAFDAIAPKDFIGDVDMPMPHINLITILEAELEDKGFQTYGQYLRWREKRNLPTRINPQKHGTLKGEYAFYPSRKMLQREFECIWSVQSGHYSEILTQDFKDKVYSELFFQRSVTTPPPGKCQYFPDEERLAKCSRLFQRRRIFEECNNLKFYSK